MKLLLNEEPLLVLPSLAAKIGLQESIFLQQLHYWLNRSTHVKDGHRWIYNSYKEWQKQFPFWSEKTISRIVKKLEDAELIICDNFNSLVIDKTKWYRINYDKLEELEQPKSSDRQNGASTGQSDQSNVTSCPDQQDNLSVPLPEITTENTTDIKNNDDDTQAPEEIEKPVTAFQFYEQNGFGLLNSYVAEKVNAWIDDLNEELVIYAMKLALENNVLRWNYVESILKNWFNKNLKTMSEVEADQLRFEAQQKQKTRGNSKSTGRKEVVPEWFNERNNKSNESVQVDENKQREFEARRKKMLESLGIEGDEND